LLNLKEIIINIWQNVLQLTLHPVNNFNRKWSSLYVENV